MDFIQYIKLIKFSNAKEAHKLNVTLAKGYRYILKNKNLVVDQLIQDICTRELEAVNKYSTRKIFGNLSLRDLSLYKSQVVTNALFNSFYFNRVISFYYAKNSFFVFPIKKEWDLIFEDHGIKTNVKAGRILWLIFIFLLTVRQFLNFMRDISFGMHNFKSKSTHAVQNLKQNSIYFCNLGKSNISCNMKDRKERNFVNWYTQNIASENFTNIYHNVVNLEGSAANYEYGRMPLLIYHKKLFFKSSANEYIKNLGVAIVFMFKICFKKDDFALVLFNLGGCIDSANAISNVKFTNLKTVVFHNSVGSIKPLWAVALERQNVLIDYCFYSTNSEPLDEHQQKKTDALWILAGWSRYVVFDELQKQDLQDQLVFQGTVQIAKVLPWWSDIEFDIPDLGKPTISLFDTALHNQIYSRSTLNQLGWDSPEIALTYLKAVLEIAEENNLKVYYKNKRSRSNEMRNDEHFYGVISLLAKFKNSLFEIDDRVAPVRMIESSFLTISKPLSTTAVIAKSLGKPSVYFDPTGKLIPTDPSCRGCKVLKSKHELNSFIQNLLMNAKNSS